MFKIMENWKILDFGVSENFKYEGNNPEDEYQIVHHHN